MNETGGKSFGKGRTVHFAEADTEWYAEQIAHSISGDAAELEVTWSLDPDEAIWWCGVLDPSIPGPDVMDWSEDWSYSESSPCAGDVFPEQSQVLALLNLPNVANRLRYWWPRRIELWLRPDQRWHQQNKTAVVSSLLPMCLPVVRAKERAR